MGSMICKATNKSETANNPSNNTNINQQSKRFSFGDNDAHNNHKEDMKLQSSPGNNFSRLNHSNSIGTNGNKQSKTIVNPSNKKKYEITRLCGKGYYSKVYKCYECKEIYAIKTLITPKKNTLNTNESIVKGQKHLNQDNAILPLFSSVYIIKLIDAFISQTEDKQYIVYPYYNLDLFTLLKQVKVLPEKIIQVILLQVYCAIQYLHTNNYLYRDIKPENIMIDITNGLIKLIDFGLAISNENETIIHKEICGTSEYVSPEAIQESGYNVDFDWWGFGIFAYELSNGRPPFTGKNQQEIFKAILTQELLFTNENSSDELIDLIGSLLKKDKMERITEENIPYHPFFRSVDYNMIKSGSANTLLRDYVIKYKDYNNYVIDQPNSSSSNNSNKGIIIH